MEWTQGFQNKVFERLLAAALESCESSKDAIVGKQAVGFAKQIETIAKHNNMKITFNIEYLGLDPTAAIGDLFDKKEEEA